MSTVAEIKAAIETLSADERANLERWLQDSSRTDADTNIPEEPSTLDPEEDTPELEAALLKGINSPLKPYSPAEMQAICDQIVREHRRK